MKRTALLAAIVLGGMGLAVAAAPQAPAGLEAWRAGEKPIVVEIQKVRNNLYMLTGEGNTAAFITGAGVVLVDTKTYGWGPAILEKLRMITDKPVTTIINTHTHGDHVGGNEVFGATVEIVTHQNTKANMDKMLNTSEEFVRHGRRYFPSLKGKPHALPDRTFADRLTLGRGAEQIDLYYFGRGHTDGDAVVVFPSLRVLHTGDLFSNKGIPFADPANGGSAVEFPETLMKLTRTVRNVDTVIPGHAPLMTWTDLLDYAEFNREIVAAARVARQAGKTPEQAAAELKLPAKFSSWNTGNAPATMMAIYKELGR